jgi:aminoglycoside phosphotransferase (APT) family kinase protein
MKRSYLVERGGARFVLRVDEPLARQWRLDRRGEARVLATAFDAGVGPELVAADFRAPTVFLLRYLPGRAWTPAELREHRRLEQLAGLLRRVHAIRVPGPPLDLAAVAERYARRAGGRAAPVMAQEVRLLLGQVATTVAPTAQIQAGSARCGSDGSRDRFSLCHHDPIPANIVGLRHPRLIDWEYAGPGDPLFDLAAVARHYRLPARGARFFRAAYFGGSAAGPAGDALGAWEEIYDRIVLLWEAAMRA